MKNSIILIIGAAIGFLFSVSIYFYYSFKQVSEPSRARVEHTKKMIEEEQNTAGTTCMAAPKMVSSYVNSIPPYVEMLKKNERIDPSSPVLLEGRKTVEIFFTCRRVNMMAEAVKLELPSPPIFDDNNLHTSIVAIHLAIGQASAEWCESKCFADALQKVTTYMKKAKDQLAQYHA